MTYKTKVMCKNCKSLNELIIPKKKSVEEVLKEDVECDYCKVNLSSKRGYIQ